LTLVVDASVAVKWSVPEVGTEAAAELLSRQLVAPDLFLAEFGNALTKKVRQREITADQARQAFAECRRTVELLDSDLLAPLALELSIALHHNIYDCYYLALADSMEWPLVTADAVFVTKVRAVALGSRVHLLGEEIEE
jgi:predicted nucleic acid-binding protein